jgi:catechol 2,3-dioxygenase-like lactoylglutathione lyase family enzyme
VALTLGRVTFLVRDYDEAIAFFTQALGFTLIEDTPLTAAKRWVVVSPSADDGGTALLLAKAGGPAQEAAIGNQTGGRVGFFLFTDDIKTERTAMAGRGVVFLEATRVEPYGSVAVFADLYGNLWDLIERA